MVEDTRAIGRPIILSDIPVHREQDPENAYYFNPESVENMIDCLTRVWPNLGAGPDTISELKAASIMEKKIIYSARKFCEIILKASN